MSLRTYVFSLITSDLYLRSKGINENSVFTQHSVDTPQVRPMIVLRWGATVPGVGPIDQRTLQVWVHDKPGSYNTINDVLGRVRALLRPLVGVNVGGVDEWITSINWRGDSDDLRDDEAGTITRNAEFRITGSAAS